MSEARDYYVSMIRGEGPKAKYLLMAGPFATHQEALDMVEPVRKEADRLDPRAHFDWFGTCSKPQSAENKMGWLNVYVGAKPRELSGAA